MTGAAHRDHDRDKGRLLPEDDPVFRALGLSDHEGRMKPSRQGKYRQVEVKVNKPAGISSLKVHWRLGYYAPSE